MKNFNLQLDISYENGILYIYSENGSGCKYNVETLEEIQAQVCQYLENELEVENED